MQASDFPRKFYFPDVSRIPPEITERILAATDIVTLIDCYLEVRRAGPFYSARCPFHDDTSATLHINPARQIFHCFGCKKSGDAFTFVREIENITFTGALQKLADRAGIEIPKS
jgi:DNA primase